MSTDPFIALWLEAPLQAWGADSKFYRRETLDFPTKSGVLGLVCCALGAAGEQTELLAMFAALRQSVLAFKRIQSGHRTLSSVVYDFQTVGNGYNESDAWENLHIPKTLQGKRPGNVSGTKLTVRGYLQDRAFGVLLQVPRTMKDKIAQALQNPVWDLYLGRKNCAPTDFIYRGTFDDHEECKQALLVIAIEKQLEASFGVLDGDHSDVGETFILRDVPVQFGEYKKYADRKVTKIRMV